MACGDITDVELEGNRFIINIYDGTLVNMLTDGKREIENALRWQGFDFQVEIRVKEKEYSKSERDIKILKETFGDNIIIKQSDLINFRR